MKRNLFLVVFLFLGIIIIIFLGEIITIGEKIAELTTVWYAEYIFYAILFAIFAYFILYPLLKIHFAPVLPGLEPDKEWDEVKLKKFGLKLARNCNYIPNDNVRLLHIVDFKKKINDPLVTRQGLINEINVEIDNRIIGNERLGVKGINKQIVEWATTVFMVTAISPNSKVDAFSTMVLNFTMMKNLIFSAGFRPTKVQLLRLYWRILITSLLSYSVSEALKDAGTIRPLGFLDDVDASDAPDEVGTDTSVDADTDIDDDSFSLTKALSKAKLPGAIVGPALDGMTNALMTLRIGYVTRGYLKYGQNLFFNKERYRQVKKEALRDSLASMPEISKNGGKGIVKGVIDFFNGNTNTSSDKEIIKEQLCHQ